MFHTAIIAIVNTFQSLRIPYAIGGSVASGVRGIIRATNDVDFIASMESSHVKPFAASLGPDFYADEDYIRTSLQYGRSFNVIHMPTAFKMDVFPATEEFHHAQLDHATTATFDFFGQSITCRVVSAEDVLLAKLRWFRLTGNSSERQWNDLRGVVTVSGTHLDREYLKSWAAKLGVSELLQKAFAEAST
jgi:hypothetical protein